MTQIMFHNIYPTFLHTLNKYGHQIGHFDTSKYGIPSKIGLGIRCHI